MTSIRYECARGRKVVEMGLTGKPEFQQGKAALGKVALQPKCVFCSPAFRRKEWSGYVLKQDKSIRLNVKQDESIGIVQEVR